MRRKIYYKTLQDDIVSSADQNIRLPEDYEFVRKGFRARVKYSVVYFLARCFANVYFYIFLGGRIEGREKLDTVPKGQGIFLYGNHTMEVGDAFLPIVVARKKRCWAIAGTANFGIPVIGRIQPWLGALPVLPGISGSQRLSEAVRQRVSEGGCVAIYPEAHVWPYCTFIRPYDATSFHYPASCGATSFVMTTTYTRRRFGKKPRITVHIDGPFVADPSLGIKQRKARLCGEIRAAMEKSALRSDYRYVEYLKDDNNL